MFDPASTSIPDRYLRLTLRDVLHLIERAPLAGEPARTCDIIAGVEQLAKMLARPEAPEGIG